MAIDATVGGADANSYVTLAEMTAYAATQSWNATWTAYTQDKKEISLISATKWLDTLTYKGSRNATTQRLSWPRTGATFDGVTSSATAIPAQIKTAQMELSWQLLQDPDALITRGTAPQGTYLAETKLGDLVQKYQQYEGSSPASIDNINDPKVFIKYPWLRDLIGGWLGGLSGGVGFIERQ
tara:strand:+ start:473 stop:1018 length:546 start_codon:yes stop_codon:yes gene_type:complete